MAKRVCAEPGCPTLTTTTRCTTHTRTQDKARGTRQARGYDAAHDTERARWQRILNVRPVSCANPHCLTPDAPIDPQSWHLGHTPDRTTWRGPEHPLCNVTEAGKHSPNRT